MTNLLYNFMSPVEVVLMTCVVSVTGGPQPPG